MLSIKIKFPSHMVIWDCKFVAHKKTLHSPLDYHTYSFKTSGCTWSPWLNSSCQFRCKKITTCDLFVTQNSGLNAQCIWVESKTLYLSPAVDCLCLGPSIYRESPVSAVFWSPANRTIEKTALIEDCYSTIIAIWDFWILKVPFFAYFHYWNLTRFFLFWVEVSENKLKCKSNGSWLHYITKEREFMIFIMKKYKKNAWKKLKKHWFFFEN